MLSILLSALAGLVVVHADRQTDAARLGEFFTGLPLYRSETGTNILKLGLGSPPQEFSLTLTTNVAFIAVAGDSCDRYLDNANEYWNKDSSSFTGSGDAFSYTSVYPSGNRDTLLLTGRFGQDIIRDERADLKVGRPIGILDAVKENSASGTGGTDTRLITGSSGFFGLGIFDRSILPSMMTVTTEGQPSGATYYTVGFNISQYSNAKNAQAGTVHWGGVPEVAYQGNFEWLNVKTSVGGGLGVAIDRIRVGSNVIDTVANYASLDPGFDSIFVPTALAERFFESVPGAQRDAVDKARWNVPCDANISMTVTLANHEYRVASSELVQPRDAAGRTCWSSVVSWENGSIPEAVGEIRLGTPFLSGVYSALYYSPGQRFVGLAGKPGSVNALDVSVGEPKGANGKLAGILIGTLFGLLLVGLLLCYSRNRNSWQSMWYRSVRRQHRMQTNAMVRAATLPPLMMIPPTGPLIGMPPIRPTGPIGPIGPMGPMPMGPMGPYARPPMAPGAMGAMQAPPAYQPPMQQGHGPAQQGLAAPQQPLPPVVEHQSQGFYSPRQQHNLQPSFATRKFQSHEVPPRMKQTTIDQYQGIPHPHPHPARRHSDQSHQSRVKWGSVVAKHRSQPSSSSDMARKVPRRVSEQWRDGRQRHDAWLNQYSGPGQTQQPYPVHDPPRVETKLSGSIMQHDAMGTAEATTEKKRAWSLVKRSKAGSKGDYSILGQPVVDLPAVSSYPAEKTEKRRSWLGGKSGSGIAASEGARTKLEEREQEREALAVGEGSNGMYGA